MHPMPDPDAAAPIEADSGAAAAPAHIDSLLLVDFTTGGNSAPYQAHGWSSPEARLAWAVGAQSGLRLPAPWDTRPRVLEIDVNPCRYAPHLTGQSLSVGINGHSFGTHLLLHRTVLHCLLTPDIWHGRDSIEVTFDHPNFFVPRLLRQSADGRALAVSFFSARLYSQHAPRPTVALPVLPMAALEPLVLAERPPPVPPQAAPAEARPAVYEFGVRKPGSGMAREGWAPPELRFQWTDDTFARLEVPAPAASGPHLLRLSCSTFVHPTLRPLQDVSVAVNGRMLAHLQAGQRATFALPLPTEEAPWGEALQVGLHLPDAARPVELGISADSRRLGLCLHSIAVEPLPPALTGWAGRRVDEVAAPLSAPPVADHFRDVLDADLPAAVTAQLGLTPAALLRDFESLGENCEFGIAQRKLDLEVLGLFRFGFTSLDSLLRGFADDFKALADPDAVTVAASEGKRPEFVIAVDAYKMRWHTFVYTNEGDAETVRRGHATKLGFVRRKFLESLRASRKIFVLKRERPLTLPEVLPVLQEINRTGRNTLLYVVPGAPPERHGVVERVGPGLLRGHISAFSPYDDVMSVAAADWLRLCANAWTLRDQDALPAAAAVALPGAVPEPAPVATAAPPAPVAPEVMDRFCAPSNDDLPAVVIAGLGLTPAELLRDFESLGENCEFGIAQRKVDLEVLGLFRFGFVSVESLLRGFADDFAAIASPDAVTVSANGDKRPEYSLAVAAYGMRWHTFVYADQADAETTRRQQATKLVFMRRKFLEALRASRKIFVLKRQQPLTEAEVLAVWEAINRTGRNTLLYVVPGAPPDRVGAVELVRPGLMRGHIGAFAPNADVMAATSASDWLRLCANAWALRVRDEQPAAAAPVPPAVLDPAPGVAPPLVATAVPAEPEPPRPEVQAMLRDCESLGNSSEFGIVQQKLGVATLGLFRFAETPLPGLLAGFAEEFAAIGDPALLTSSVSAGPRPEHVLSLPRYGMVWPTGVAADAADAATPQRQAMKLGYLRRKFLDALRGPARMFVLRRDEPLREDEIMPLAEALWRYGRHTLLYIVQEDGVSGAVAQLRPGLLRGTLPSLAPAIDPAAADVAAWVTLMTNAWPLHLAHAGLATGETTQEAAQ